MRMRMPSALSTLLAVLCGAVAGAGDAGSAAGRERRAPPQPQYSHRLIMDEDLNATASWKRTHWREMQSLLREGSVECCPSVREMVAPMGGQTPSGLYVMLYQDGENVQQFYEQSCAVDVAGKPCRFVDARLYNQSRCVQKYSYSYALVRNATKEEVSHHRNKRDGLELPATGGWSLDYILVRAGCECQIMPPDNNKKRKMHKKRLERHKQGRKNRFRMKEDAET